MEHRNYWSRSGKKLRRRQFLRGGAIVGGATLGAALLGCGEEDESPTSSSPADSSPSSPSAQGSTPAGLDGTRYTGGTITIGEDGDPALYASPRNSTLASDMNRFSIYGDAYLWVGGDGDFVDEEGLFESYEFSDSTTLVGTLRPDILFHDGNPFDAEAAKAHLDFIRDPERASVFAYRSLVGSIDEVSVVDDLTLSFSMNTPDVALPTALGVNPGVPFSVAEVERSGEDELLKPVMTGPYQVDRHDIGGDIRYVRNEQYWRTEAGGPPYADDFLIRSIPQQEARAATLETQGIDVSIFDSDQTTLRMAEDPELQGARVHGTMLYIYLNITIPPWDDLRVRQAFAHSIDKEKVVESIYFGQAQPHNSWVPPETYGWNDYEPYPYDPQRSNELLQATGLELPLQVPFYYPGAGYLEGGTMTQLVAIYEQSMNEGGFEVDLQQLPHADEVRAQLFDDLTLPIGIPFGASVRPDPGLQYQTFLSSEARFNPSREATIPEVAQIDDLIAEGKVEIDREDRRQIYIEIQKVARDAVYQALPITRSVDYVFAGANIGGFDNPNFINQVAGGSIRPRYLWLKE